MYKEGGGGAADIPPKVFLIFFLDNKASAPEVFCSCLFITRAILSLVMVSYYGYKI